MVRKFPGSVPRKCGKVTGAVKFDFLGILESKNTSNTFPPPGGGVERLVADKVAIFFPLTNMLPKK